MSKPLEGVRVLDLSRLLPGPYASLILADLGAEVIKLESPSKPDYLRDLPPQQEGVQVGYAFLNRNKRPIQVAFETSEGQAVVRRLAAGCDVLLESFRAGYLARFGLDYAGLGQQQLIYCSLSGYGQTGPRAGVAGHDLNFIAITGLASLLGAEVPRAQLADLGSGMAAALAVVTALFERTRTGRGRYLDLALSDAPLALTGLQSAYALAGGVVPVEQDVLAGSLPVYRYYRCADGAWLAVAALESHFYERVAEAIGLENWDHELAQSRFAERSRSDWLERLAGLDVCVEPVLEPGECFARADLAERHRPRQVTYPGGATHPQPPGLLDACFGSEPTGYLELDSQAQTTTVLREAGFSAEELAQLSSRGIIPAQDAS